MQAQFDDVYTMLLEERMFCQLPIPREPGCAFSMASENPARPGADGVYISEDASDPMDETLSVAEVKSPKVPR